MSSYEGGFNFEDPTDSDTNNVYSITVFADDGFNRTTQNVEITIQMLRRAVFSIGPEISILKMKECCKYNCFWSRGDAFLGCFNSGDDGSLFRYFGIILIQRILDLIVWGARFRRSTRCNSDSIYEPT